MSLKKQMSKKTQIGTLYKDVWVSDVEMFTNWDQKIFLYCYFDNLKKVQDLFKSKWYKRTSIRKFWDQPLIHLILAKETWILHEFELMLEFIKEWPDTRERIREDLWIADLWKKS